MTGNNTNPTTQTTLTKEVQLTNSFLAAIKGKAIRSGDNGDSFVEAKDDLEKASIALAVDNIISGARGKSGSYSIGDHPNEFLLTAKRKADMYSVLGAAAEPIKALLGDSKAKQPE